MKTISFFLTAALLLTAATSYAQQYAVRESDVPMDKGQVNAWVIKVDEPLDALKKNFAKYAKSQWNVKMKKSGHEMLVAREVTIPAITEKAGDLKAKFYTVDGDNAIAVAFMPGYDVALNTYDNTQDMNNLKKFVKNFVKTFKSDQIQQAIDQDDKRIRELQSDLKKDEREYQSLNKHIDRNEKSITNTKEDNEHKIFDLKNENIGNRAQLAALDTMMVNIKEEITRIQDGLTDHRTDLSNLESRFEEDPYVRKDEDDH